MNDDYRERIQQYANYVKGLLEQGQPVNMYPDEWFRRKIMYEAIIEQIESGQFENAWDQISREDFGEATELLLELMQIIENEDGEE
jgi:hypothetical protein